MKNLKKIALATILAFSFGAVTLGSFAGGNTTLLAGSSNQFDEDDVGSIYRDGIFLAGSSNQFDEDDVGSIHRDGTIFFAGSSNQFDEGDVG